MAITYKGFRLLCVKHDTKPTHVQKELGLSNDVITSLNKDRYVSLRTLEIVAEYFNCDIGDIVSIKKDSTD